MAELKLNCIRVTVDRKWLFPRLKGRGRIEAPEIPVNLKSFVWFPRLKARGRIEARPTKLGTAVLCTFPRLKGRGRIEATYRLLCNH